ncbi:MAG TPA: rubrerythrin family protein [Candidatus Sumerlaeota bacterium]|nr:rubrerythrin family protein [Candidatus Sumerlaeota bacterium]
MKRRDLLKATLATGLTVGLGLTSGCGEKTPPPKTEPKKSGETKPEDKKGTEEKKGAATAIPETTLKNLQTAFNGESNAKARYEAFAKKADEEGYGQVASLFRAAAMAEGVHAAGYEKLIVSAGATAQADIKPPEVKSTKENLEAAVAGETEEKEKMYPGFVAQAKTDKADMPELLFSHALAIETEHAKFYQSALGDLENWKAGKKEFLVCERCGYTALWTELDKCPICSEPKKGLIKVS